MVDFRTRPPFVLDGLAWRRMLPQTLALAYLVIGLAAYLAAPFLAFNWIQQPFIGAFVEQSLIFNGVGPTDEPDAWSARSQGLALTRKDGQTDYYQLKAVDGAPIGSARDLSAALARRLPGDRVTLLVQPSGRQVQEVPVILSRFPASDQIAYFFVPYLIGLVYLAAGGWVFAIRRSYASGRVFAQFAVSVALCLGLLFDLYTTHILTGLWVLALALLGGSVVGLGLLFPREDPLVQRAPWRAHTGSVVGLVLVAFAVARLPDLDQPLAFVSARNLIYGFTGLAVLFMLGWAVYRGRQAGGLAEPKQARALGLAALASFSPTGLWLIAAGLGFAWPFKPYLFFPLVIFPLAAVYTIHRHRMRQADAALRTGLLYGLLLVLLAVGYALMAAGLSLGLSSLILPGNPIFTAFIFFVLALALDPLRQNTRRVIDRVFFRGRRAYQERLQTFSGELTRAVDLAAILAVLRRYVEETLAPKRLHIYLYDPLSDQYAASVDHSGQPTSDLRFSVTARLPIYLTEQREPVILGNNAPLSSNLEPDRARLILLGAQAFAALPGRQRLAGWLALGPRLSGEPYTSLQLGFAEALCEQAALAIERAQVVANMENRVHQMDVLTRIAQGVNITLALDDILELVYAQTTHIIAAQHFFIMLYNKAQDIYQYVFYLEKDERLADQENRPVQSGQALEQEIIRQRRPILTGDFNRECQFRGVLLSKVDVYAWMGVPLNAGAETIGALALGSADPAVEYTSEQQTLLLAIADQVAGALVKARLLEETGRRARQLSTLNEVTRQLTSTLEPDPLLQSILHSAVEILNCEAGSLMMVNQSADELVFRVTTGPVADTLINSRMPADRGVAGKAARLRQPVIVNDVTHFPDWFADNDCYTGFVTRALLAIPLMVKESVIGVIEVMNKQDGSPFSHDDQELLSAFASQAAVAIENARLYTLTDQALAERVEELSVMQRIDRELNISLDTLRAMRITLEWAMRQSGASAGIVGVLQEDDPSGVRVMASEGYPAELESNLKEPLPVDVFQLQEAIQGGVSVRRSLNEAAPQTLLEGARSQAIIPIRRESNTIGLLLLESTQLDFLSDETMGFLSRLTDHASIAISNAQLYAAVQSANLAKSDFVSFVAHELKNPMTSVKGYTELISAGTVGPITDMQANFLVTIRHNIERMNTLISDLNDMSKIEVGRLRLEFKPASVQEIIDSVVRSTHRQIEEKNQTLTLHIPAGLPPIWADRSRVEQVIVNLVSNAHKYTPPEGVIEMAAEDCPNQWDPQGAARVIHLWVRDNGIGINEEDQQKIFQKFFRSEDPKTREVTGAGLGLNITRSLVEMQGGKIWFESEFRKGTTFHFTIPVSES